MAAQCEVKGSAFVSMLATIEQQKGAAFREAVQARVVDAELQGRLRTNSIMPGSWMPAGWYRALLQAVFDAGMDDAGFAAVSRTAATRDVTTLYRVVFAMLSPELLARQGPRLFGLFYRGGVVRPVEVRKGYAMVEYEGWHGFDARMWRDYIHGSDAVFALAGAKGIASTIHEGGDGATMKASVTWS